MHRGDHGGQLTGGLLNLRQGAAAGLDRDLHVSRDLFHTQQGLFDRIQDRSDLVEQLTEVTRLNRLEDRPIGKRRFALAPPADFHLRLPNHDPALGDAEFRILANQLVVPLTELQPHIHDTSFIQIHQLHSSDRNARDKNGSAWFQSIGLA